MLSAQSVCSETKVLTPARPSSERSHAPVIPDWTESDESGVIRVAEMVVGQPLRAARAANENAVQDSEDPTRTVFREDPYTAGAGSTDKEHRWTTLVSIAQGWYEINLESGRTGYLKTSETAGCGRVYCPNYDEMADEAAALSPARVVVSGRQNDFGRDLAAVEKSSIRQTYDPRAALPDLALQQSAESVGATYFGLISPDILDSNMASFDGGHVDGSGHVVIATNVDAGLTG